MRISSGIVLAGLLLVGASGAVEARDPVRRGSPQVAFERGLDAYKAGSYAAAIPVLEEAAANGGPSSRFFAAFYLARIYSDGGGGHVDHARALDLFEKLADENADIDPDDEQRARFVAKAMTALAGYLMRGVEGKRRPDPERAVEYLHHAATVFGDKDAQFELAKIYLSNGRSGEDVARGMHFLSVLSEESYPAAQAYLADLYWRGRYVKRDERRALALITMAVGSAPAHERVWIEEIYAQVYCATSQGTRKQADGIVALWRKLFARPEPNERAGLAGREAQSPRSCGNGEVVDIQRTAPPVDVPAAAAAIAAPAGRPDSMQGAAAAVGGFSLRDAAASERPARK